MGSKLLRFILLVSASAACLAQTAADQAYDALRAKDYDRAIADFKQAVEQAPERADLRKDLAYTLLKTGETEAARDQFAEAMRIDPKDDQASLEYAFLCYETRQPVLARRIFDRLRNASGPAPDVKKTAAEAFENVDRPLREGIERWQNALQLAPDNFSAHEELARLAEQRDDLPLASEHYERAWRLRPDRRDLLIDLARVWHAMNRDEKDADANAALIAAWRGGTPRVSEEARDLLPARYPFLSEFQKALALDPANLQLQRDVAYQKGEPAPAAEAAAAPVLESRPEEPRPVEDAKTVGLRSLEKGYLPDALKYLQLAHEADPSDFEVMLKLGWTFNLLKDDETALHWFDQARHSPDPAIAEEALRAYRNLAPSLELFRTTFWAFPIYSSRWQDLFGYAQAKTEVRLRRMPFLHPYVSVRLLGDVRGEVNAAFGPEYLSERSIIFAGGLATQSWHGVNGLVRGRRGADLRRNSNPAPPLDAGLSRGHLLRQGLRQSVDERLARKVCGDQHGWGVHQPVLGRFDPVFAEPRRIYVAVGRRRRRLARPTGVEREHHGGRETPILGQLRRDRAGCTLPLRELTAAVFGEPAARSVPGE